MFCFAFRHNPRHPAEVAVASLEALIHELRSRKTESPAQTFTLFSQLPPEIRLLIWKAALPTQQLNPHTVYSIWDSDWTAQYDYRLPGKLEAPTGLLGACSESRAVGLATGSFLQRRYKLLCIIPWGCSEPIWFDHRIKTLMMPVGLKAVAELSVFPQNLQYVATLTATDFWMAGTLRLLGHKRHSHNIRTILNGIMWIPLRYSKGNNPETHPCVGSDTTAIPLDDPKIVDYLTSAFECHALTTLRARIDPACYRKSARNFLVFNKFLTVRNNGEHPDLPDGFKLKPAIIFGRPHLSEAHYLEEFIRVMDTFLCRSVDDEDLEQWHSWTPFGTNSDLFQYKTKFYEQTIRDLIRQ